MLLRVPVAAFLTVLSLPAYCQSPPASKLTNVPDFVLYDHFLFRVVWLENQANSLKAQGKDDTFMRSWMQTKAGLSDQETASLKAIATDCRATPSAIVSAVRSLAAAGANFATSQQVQSLASQRRQTVLDHMGQLQTALGPARFAVLDAYVRQTVKIPIGPAAPPPASVKPPGGPAPRQ